MAISKKLLEYLAENKYKFTLIEHKTTFTAWDTAQTEKTDPKAVAKALVMKADRNYFLALIPGNRNLDKQKLLKMINAKRKKIGLGNFKKIDFAKESWMKINLPGRVGATPPFRRILKLDLYIDNLLVKNKKIYVGSGEYTSSILVNTGQYVKNEKTEKGSFSKKK